MDISLRKIIYIVAALHLVLITILGIAVRFESTPPKRERVVVRTVKLQPSVELAMNAPVEEQVPEPVVKPAPPAPVEQAAPKKPEPPKKEKKEQKKVEPPPKKEIKKEKKKEKEKVKEKEKPKQKVGKEPPVQEKKREPEMSDRQRDLIAKAQQSISKIDKERAKLSPSQSGKSSLLSQLSFNEELEAGEIGYYEDLAGRLKSMLRLPERGDVEIELTISRAGTFQGVKVVKTKSDINRDYVVKAIKELRYPPFNKHFDGEKEHTFKITLSDAR